MGMPEAAPPYKVDPNAPDPFAPEPGAVADDPFKALQDELKQEKKEQ
jgi:hypothetical protein